MNPSVDLTRATGPALPLWDSGRVPGFDASLEQNEPALYPYLLKGKPEAGTIIVCPGGGYARKAPHEAEPVALRFNEMGFHAFVLDYRVSPYCGETILSDGRRAVRVARANAESLGINGDKIAILGFSAGGHLAAYTATNYDKGRLQDSDPVERVSSRPDAAVLCYAVQNFTAYPHIGSLIKILGESSTIRDRAEKSPELNVTCDTPPMFLWHTAQDAGVPAMNSVSMAEQLILRGIPCALHIYPFGRHGIGLGTDNEQAGRWPQEAGLFLRGLGF